MLLHFHDASKRWVTAATARVLLILSATDNLAQLNIFWLRKCVCVTFLTELVIRFSFVFSFVYGWILEQTL